MVKKNKGKAKVTIKAKEKKWKYDPSLKGFFKFCWRTFVIAIFIIYLVVGYTGTFFWAKFEAHRSLNVENLAKRVMDYKKRRSHFNSLFTVYVQKKENSKQVIEQLLPLMPQLEAIFYFEMAKRYMLIGEFKEAVFWHMLGSFYTGYDNARCEGIKDKEFLNDFIQALTPLQLVIYLQKNKDIIVDIEQRVTNWLLKYQFSGSPEYFCKIAKLYYNNPDITGEAVPKSEWISLLNELLEEIKQAKPLDIKKKEQSSGDGQ